MSKIDEMLKNEKVEWKRLGEVCYIQRGRVISKTYLEEHTGNYPVYSSQTKNNGEIGRINTYDFDGEYVTWTTDGAYAGTVFYRNTKFSITNICGLISPKDTRSLLTKFVAYWLQIEAKKHVKGGSGNPKLMSNVVSDINIPIPSLQTQEKIVKILDTFTELQTELQMRTKQYTYYRDMLLSEDYLNKISEKIFVEKAVIEWKTLGELFEFKNGLNKGKEFFGKGTPIINYTDVYKKNKMYSLDLLGSVETTEEEQKRYSVKRGDVFFTRTSETQEEIGKTSVLLENIEKGVFSGFLLRARPITELLLPEYCAYCFETHEFRKNVIRYSTYTTRALTNGGTLSNLEIPVPPLEIQNKVVQILDKFQSLVEDTKGLLPQEIEQRKKQYEYYREKLLNFPKNDL